MVAVVKRTLASWGNYPRQPASIYYPQATRELTEILACREQSSYSCYGLGRSYGDAALNCDGGVLCQQRLNRLLHWDPREEVLECEAGVSYQDILNCFLPRGYIVPVTPGTKFVTIGGAIAADVHGKNHHRDGSLAQFLVSFQLLTGGGCPSEGGLQVLTCSRTENSDVFWATLGGMGLTGVILSARLKLQRVGSAWLGVDYRRAANLDQALELFSTADRSRYSVAWIDCLARGPALGRAVLMQGEYLAADELPVQLRSAPLQLPRRSSRTVPVTFPGWVLNSFSVRAFNELYYRCHRDQFRVVDSESFFYPLDSVGHWNRIYGRRGFVQYQMVVPPAGSRRALVRILEQISQSGRASFLAVLKTFGPGNPGLLSFPTAGATLALDLPFTGPPLLQLLEELDRIVLDHGGRVYLAKDARLGRSAFEGMYPRVGEFRRLKQKLDPEGLFSSSLARRLGLVEPAGKPSPLLESVR